MLNFRAIRQYVLVTGATGFIGAHVVDDLLSRGLKVRGATRSVAKGAAMIEARPQFKGQLDFVQIEDFEKLGVFADAVKDVDAVIHVASVCESCIPHLSFIHRLIMHPSLSPMTPRTTRRN